MCTAPAMCPFANSCLLRTSSTVAPARIRRFASRGETSSQPAVSNADSSIAPNSRGVVQPAKRSMPTRYSTRTASSTRSGSITSSTSSPAST